MDLRDLEILEKDLIANRLADIVREVAEEIHKANPEMKMDECLLVAALMDREGMICLPIAYNAPEGWIDVTTEKQKSIQPNYRFYMKGRDVVETN